MLLEPKDNLIGRNFAIRTDQEVMLVQFAKEQDRSVSGALRLILDDWVNFKRAALEAARPLEQHA